MTEVSKLKFKFVLLAITTTSLVLYSYSSETLSLAKGVNYVEEIINFNHPVLKLEERSEKGGSKEQLQTWGQDSAANYPHDHTDSLRMTSTLKLVSKNSTETTQQQSRDSLAKLKPTDSSVQAQPQPSVSSQPQPTVPTHPPSPTGSGYLIALSIYEQQTMATGNIIQLQCFASKLNLSVVQPLMKNSFFSTPLNWSEHADMLQMEDVYNMKEWREHTGGKGYAPLVRWEEFIDHAPRDVILVQMKYHPLLRIVSLQKHGVEFPHPVSEDKRYKHGCDYRNVTKAFQVLKAKNFTVIEKLCYNYRTGDLVPLETYKREMYGGLNLTVIVDDWRGFGGIQRALVEDEICPEADIYREWTNSSTAIVRDAERYVDKYLSGPDVTGYLAVMTRFEWTALRMYWKKNNMTDRYAVVPYCLQKTLEMFFEMRKEVGEGLATFLSADFGKYGSVGYSKTNYYNHERELKNFVSSVYGGQLNITEWERTFESVVESTDAGCAAKVQQAIVARAKCVLFVGGGTFQRHTFHLYQQLHPDPADRCVRVLKECTNLERTIE